jgi:hypothetical protein
MLLHLFSQDPNCKISTHLIKQGIFELHDHFILKDFNDLIETFIASIAKYHDLQQQEMTIRVMSKSLTKFLNCIIQVKLLDRSICCQYHFLFSNVDDIHVIVLE